MSSAARFHVGLVGVIGTRGRRLIQKILLARNYFDVLAVLSLIIDRVQICMQRYTVAHLD